MRSSILLLAVVSLAACSAPSARSTEDSTQQPDYAGDGALPRLPVEIADGQSAVGSTVADLRVTTLAGAELSFDELARGRVGLVVAMASAECPIARKYAPRLAAIESEFGGRFAFLHVNTVEGESEQTLRGFIQEFGIRGTYARDDDGAVRRELRPKTTTEVFVLDADRRLRYRGAIDDQFRFGGAAQRPTRDYLKDALTALSDGRSPPVRSTAAPGCLVDIPSESAGATAAAVEQVSFYPRIAEVLSRNCAECHHLGGPAPFNLGSPSDVKGRAAMIAAVVREGVMPPNHGVAWKGAAAPVLHRSMPGDGRELLLAWLNSAQTIGDPALAPPPTAPARTWAIGMPDLLLTSPGFALDANDPTTFSRYIVPVNIEADRWVAAIECRPMMRDSIEVAQVWLLAPGARLPGPDEFPRDAELFATFSRSDQVVRFGEGVARRLPRGSVLVADILARPMARRTQGQLRIGMKLTDTPLREVRTIVVAPERLTIPAGESDVRVEAGVTLDRAARLVAVHPVMGPRGRTLSVELRPRSAAPMELLELRRHDWRWQIRYPLAQPIEAPAGSKLMLRARFDNSASNPANPDASIAPTLGAGLKHELLAVSIEYETDPDAASSR